ncbi:MAG: ABC transporter substrate-binding protein [Chitinophagaceae bacterium]|nr:ABC transporter substrate-binding protein [Chitinophagaceae bacterium]
MILRNTIDLGYRPKRIVSLVPSQTELLHYLGLDAETIGITRFCIHPGHWLKSKTHVGGTKTLDLKKIRQLNPDLVIANSEENVKEQVESLAADFPVWVTDVSHLAGALTMIEDIGCLTGKKSIAARLVSQIKENFNGLNTLPTPIPVSYLIWRDPYMVAGGGTFINDMLLLCGFVNIHAGKARYPVIEIASLPVANQHNPAGCQLLLLSSEPYPFKQKHIDELRQHLPGIKIILVDGDMFSWYGSRLLESTTYFRQLLDRIKADTGYFIRF